MAFCKCFETLDEACNKFGTSKECLNCEHVQYEDGLMTCDMMGNTSENNKED